MRDTRVYKPKVYKSGTWWFVWYEYNRRPNRFVHWKDAITFALTQGIVNQKSNA